MNAIWSLALAGALIHAGLSSADDTADSPPSRSPPAAGTAQRMPPLAELPPVSPPGVGAQPVPAPALTIPEGAAAAAPTSFAMPGADGFPRPRIWGGLEYLLWWTKSVPVTTPLWTQATNPALAPPFGNSGSLGSPETAILLGGQSYGLGAQAGGRFTLGTWIDPDGQWGVEGTYLFIAPRSTTQSSGSSGSAVSPTLGFPYLDAKTGMEAFSAIAFPGLPGSASLTETNQLQSGELNLLRGLIRSERLTVSGLAGFRYIYFQENVDFRYGNHDDTGHLFLSNDHFEGANNFFGANLGLRGEYRLGDLFVNVTGKIALGAMDQNGTVFGSTLAINTVPTATQVFPAGTFALLTNSGKHAPTVFAVVPEVTCNLGYDVTKNVRLFLGYNFLYLNSVTRPGTNFDHALNPGQVPGLQPVGVNPGPIVGPAVPAYPFNRTDFWAQGVNFGLQLRY
jgi:hypothetical protein